MNPDTINALSQAVQGLAAKAGVEGARGAEDQAADIGRSCCDHAVNDISGFVGLTDRYVDLVRGAKAG